MTKRAMLAAISMAFSASFLLCGYEFGRSASYTLFKRSYGAENLVVVMSLVPFAVFALVFFYGWLLTRLGPRRTLRTFALLSSAVFVFLYWAIRSEIKESSILLFLFREGYVVLLIEQYWSFLNSTLRTEEATKLNGPIIGISSLGAISGGVLVSKLAVPLGTEAMLLFAAFSLLPAALVSEWGFMKCGEPVPPKKEGKKGWEHLSLSLFKSSRLLLLMLLLILTTQLLAALLTLNFQTLLQVEIPDTDKQTAYLGGFYASINGVAALVQFVLAPLMLTYVPLVAIHLLIPIIHICTVATALVIPSLSFSALAFLLFKCLDYSIFRAAKELFYIPLSYDARYRAKEVIDVFGYRLGTGGPALLITFLKRLGMVFEPLYLWIALMAFGGWIAIVMGIFRKGLIKKTPIQTWRGQA